MYLATSVMLHFFNYIQMPGCINELGPLQKFILDKCFLVRTSYLE